MALTYLETYGSDLGMRKKGKEMGEVIEIGQGQQAVCERNMIRLGWPRIRDNEGNTYIVMFAFNYGETWVLVWGMDGPTLEKDLDEASEAELWANLKVQTYTGLIITGERSWVGTFRPADLSDTDVTGLKLETAPPELRRLPLPTGWSFDETVGEFSHLVKDDDV